MKEQKLYVCDFCGTQYKEKEKCRKCEQNHHEPREIKDARYIPIGNDAKGYPTHIIVVMSDGKEVMYKR